MNHAHLPELVRQAAALIEQYANDLRDSHTFEGEWPDDDDARDIYEHETALAAQLRDAIPELGACHQTAIGLEQLLRAHREERRNIEYKELAALLPATESHT